MDSGIDFDALDAVARRAMDQFRDGVEQAADRLLARFDDDAVKQALRADVVEMAMLLALGLPGADERLTALRRRVEGSRGGER